MHNDIKFTLENGNKTINYLDLTLTVNSRRIDYKIDRKPTCTDAIIPKDSFHHPKHKMAAIKNYCHRATTILKDEEERKKEIQFVKQIARANGYQTEEVDRVIGKMLARKGEQNTTVLEYSGAVPYVGKHTDKVIMTFKKMDVNVGISNNAAMVKRISNDQTEKNETADQSGVYKITCGQCDSIYIGETGRKFSTRMKEHGNSNAKWNNKYLKRFTPKLLPEGGNLRNN